MTSWEKYAGGADRWSEDAYADAHAYLEHRAELVRTLGPPLADGDAVLDLACGDGALGDFLPGLRYLGVDASPEMVAAGRARGRELVEADLNAYEPPGPVAATLVFRAIYYARDRRAFFRRAAGFTRVKLVFDLNPRQYALEEVRADLGAAGFDRLDRRPFLVPQTRTLPRPAAALLRLLETSGPPARALLRARFTYLCAASRSGRA